MITKEQLINDLSSLGVPMGSIVTVHTSLRAVGEIEGGGETLLDALIEIFTREGGLLAIPTHTWDSDVYDLRKSESCIGTLPRLAAGRSDSYRTLHPTHSMAVFGDRERALDFIKDEESADTPANPEGCLGKLCREDGYVLLLGVGQDKNTFLHCVEEMMKVPHRLTSHKVKKYNVHPDGRREERELFWFDESSIPDVSVYFTKFEPAFRYHGAIRDGRVGNAPVQLCHAPKMKEVLEIIYNRNNFGELLDSLSPLDEKLYK